MTGGLEVWGGIECSVVRVGNTVRDQLQDTGHASRDDDIKLVAGLGLRTVRYPVLWEMVEGSPGKFDWRWTDKRLGDLNAHGISPIAGLVHHGSGPAWTDLLDPEFPEKLAFYAGRVAARYPWINMFTPVNEPFTTARICGLYGLWHPHAKDEQTCFRITVAECRAIALAMKAIRRITPGAKLVQTEDFGRIYSTPWLSDQAEYENERRWIATDLLAGRVGTSHRFYNRLIEAGVDHNQLAELQAEPCPPDILGIDYYLTSDRMLDHRLLHPDEPVGGNSRQSYTDTAAVRSCEPQVKPGLAGRLAEVWDRYKLPIAITELHNGCSRDEQLRWLMEGWNTALVARSGGIDVRAVTSWSLFGALDWNSMMTRKECHYECGAFDARYTPPQPTVVATAISHLTQNGHFDHPALDRPGWWHEHEGPTDNARPLVLAGFDRLTSAIEERCIRRRLRVLPCGRFDDPSLLFERHNAWAILRLKRPPQAIGPRPGDGPLRLQCVFLRGEELSVELPQHADGHRFLDTFLDLIVDNRRGRLRCNGQPRSAVMNALVELLPTLENTEVRESDAA